MTACNTGAAKRHSLAILTLGAIPWDFNETGPLDKFISKNVAHVGGSWFLPLVFNDFVDDYYLRHHNRLDNRTNSQTPAQ